MKKILITCLMIFLTSCAGLAGGFAAGSIHAAKNKNSKNQANTQTTETTKAR